MSIVLQHERFGRTQRCLESLCEHLSAGAPLIWVDAGSPAKIRDYLAEQSRIRGFQVIRSEHYLMQSQSRNPGAARVATRHRVFVDNEIRMMPESLRRFPVGF